MDNEICIWVNFQYIFSQTHFWIFWFYSESDHVVGIYEQKCHRHYISRIWRTNLSFKTCLTMLGIEKKHLQRILFHDKAGFGTLTAEKGVRSNKVLDFAYRGRYCRHWSKQEKLILANKTAFFVEKSVIQRQDVHLRNILRKFEPFSSRECQEIWKRLVFVCFDSPSIGEIRY